MAFFGVTTERIATSRHHTNADRLSVCTLEGMDFQFVTGKDQFKPGDEVLYFPLDAILPDAIAEVLQVLGKLAGAQKNRVKTMIFRGEISQGLVELPSKFLTPEQAALTSKEITEILGVTKFEPIPNEIVGATLYRLPTGVSVYDIEGADRYADAVGLLMDVPVQITEKMEGMNFSITIDAEGKVFVNMRENTIVPVDGVEHHFWATARRQGLLDLMPEIAAWVRMAAANPSTTVTFYGEICGPDKANFYGLKEHAVFAFDIRTDRGFIPVADFEEAVTRFKLTRAPLLSIGTTLRAWLAGKTVKQASTGPTAFGTGKRREGIVIRPMTESRWAQGRLILKQRCPYYLGEEK